jgi:hypothetical protein
MAAEGFKKSNALLDYTNDVFIPGYKFLSSITCPLHTTPEVRPTIHYPLSKSFVITS